MKKRISIIAVIAMLSVCLVSVFAGCSNIIETAAGIEDLNKCVDFTHGLEEYYLRVVELTPNESSYKSDKVETTLNVCLDDPNTTNVNEKAAKMLKKTKNEAGEPINIIKVWGDSLKKGVKVKKANDADWKRSVVWANEPNSKDQKQTLVLQDGTMTLDEFKSIPDLEGYGMQDVMDKVKLFLQTTAGKNPTSIKQEGRVYTYTYNDITAEGAAIFGEIAYDEVDGKKVYPLTIETVHSGKNGEGYVSKVSDKETNGRLRYYITMKGPNIKVPAWEA